MPSRALATDAAQTGDSAALRRWSTRLGATASAPAARRLGALVARYASADRVTRILLSAIDPTVRFQWAYRGLERSGTSFQPFAIPTVADTKQQIMLAEPDEPPRSERRSSR